MSQQDAAGHIYHRARLESTTDDSLGKIARLITEESTVLDIGCGVGALGQYLSIFKHCHCFGVESNPKAAALARPFYERLIVADIEKDNLVELVGQTHYDWIVLADVLEHLHDPGTTLSACKDLLNERGKMLISVPNISYVGVLLELLDGEFHYRPDGLLDATHRRFFTRKSFLRLLTENSWTGEVVDHIYKHIDDSEFEAVRRGGLGDKVTAALQNDPDFMTYQFIIEAVPNEKKGLLGNIVTHEEVEISGPWFYSVIYWRTAEQDYDENRSASIALRVGTDRQTARFTFPKGTHAIRLDPAERAGFLHLFGIKLYNSNELVWQWDGNVRAILLAHHDGLVLSQNRGQDGSIVFLLTSDDPQFEIPVDSEVLSFCDTLEVDISWPQSYDYRILKQEISRFEQQIDNHIQLINDYRVKEIVTQERIGDLELSLSDKEQYWTERMSDFSNTVSSLQATLSNLTMSRSWKLTRPLRGVAWFARKVRQTLSMAKTRTGLKDLALQSIARLSQYRLRGSRALLSRNPESDPNRFTSKSANHEIPRITFSTAANGYIPYKDNPAVIPSVKILAFYLPQFHPFTENEGWWGKGFTEWTNVTKAVPLFQGHDQPRRPGHFGYYDLRVPSVMEEQAKLAAQYGIYGFSYYFYWFGGTRLMESPLEMMLANKDVSLPFCLTWANENWTRRWDGLDSEVLIAQDHSDQDSLALIRYLVKYFQDQRYICVDGKPVFIVYRADIIPNIKRTVRLWREEMIRQGFPGLYLIAAQTFGIGDPSLYGFDAAIEFPPHSAISTDIRHQIRGLDRSFGGNIYSYEQVVKNAIHRKEPRYKLFRTAMLRWDNSARRGKMGNIFHGFTSLLYGQWLSALSSKIYLNRKYTNDEKLVFVNAWNEWAEGTYLEPDDRYGYAHLQMTYDVVAAYDKLATPPPMVRSHDDVVILHVHYIEVWGEIKALLDDILVECPMDIVVTTSSREIFDMAQNELPSAHLLLVDNRGRDILPLIFALREVSPLGYRSVLKLHTKRSLYRNDGDKIREDLLDALVTNAEAVRQSISRFEEDPRLGMLVPECYLIQHNDHNMTFDKEMVDLVCSMTGMRFYCDVFPAGSMFWFRPEALAPILKIDESDFPPEEGLADGTIAHAVERMFCLMVKQCGFSVKSI